ncbi:PREDICTED: uncharacterized protein LOC106149672 [Chinchilla lanigera]|uniref:uncharacterized protein LOC106149672 n=1 Tax=Chinchilla lanigera TaxID=34839 RepID=UPI0006984127|nr:PREDICTED: uncharacterized protein LOC106149672 [Chinchilla lanigera]
MGPPGGRERATLLLGPDRAWPGCALRAALRAEAAPAGGTVPARCARFREVPPAGSRNRAGEAVGRRAFVSARHLRARFGQVPGTECATSALVHSSRAPRKAGPGARVWIPFRRPRTPYSALRPRKASDLGAHGGVKLLPGVPQPARGFEWEIQCDALARGLPVIPALGRLKQAGHCEFKASLNYRARPCLKKPIKRKKMVGRVRQNQTDRFQSQPGHLLAVTVTYWNCFPVCRLSAGSGFMGGSCPPNARHREGCFPRKGYGGDGLVGWVDWFFPRSTPWARSREPDAKRNWRA